MRMIYGYAGYQRTAKVSRRKLQRWPLLELKKCFVNWRAERGQTVRSLAGARCTASARSRRSRGTKGWKESAFAACISSDLIWWLVLVSETEPESGARYLLLLTKETGMSESNLEDRAEIFRPEPSPPWRVKPTGRPASAIVIRKGVLTRAIPWYYWIP